MSTITIRAYPEGFTLRHVLGRWILIRALRATLRA